MALRVLLSTAGRTLATIATAALLAGCPEEAAAPAATGDVSSPADAPTAYKVLKDETVNNAVEYHVLVAETTKHDAMQKLLEYLYRRVMTRHEEPPASMAAFVYFNQAAYATPPRSPIAEVHLKSGDRGPSFENKVPLEFWQEIEQALEPRRDKGWKLAMKVVRDDAQKSVALTVPYTEPGVDKWATELSFNQAMQTFTDLAQALFEKVPELRTFEFSGQWNDKEVVHITLPRSDYAGLKLNEIDDRIGQHHGRAFLELSTGKGTDKSVSKENAGLVAKEYRAMLTALKGKATVANTLK